MNLFKYLDGVTIPSELLEILGFLLGIILFLKMIIILNKTLQDLTKKRIDLEKIFKFLCAGLKEAILLSNHEIEPLKIPKYVRKFFAYLIIMSLFLTLVMFLTLFIIFTLIFLIKSQNLSLSFEKNILSIGMMLVLIWASKFSYIQMRVECKKMKTI
ncbi:hypothetical protein [Acinetobacter nectaris]|uniref:hypothetical protein n=1 Tax=Acinetobacter nectaris TaxID=1219382 RepID=UPI001F22C9D8|nr:hypothetical protein [Acinetobacter nectaris]MCF9047374.1 hypothetical protein [Acinetobacter nectaris]